MRFHNQKKLLSTDLVKVFSFTGLSTLIKLITSYVTIKVVAHIIGPAGIALVGQLQNFVSIFTTIGAGGINNGVVKYVSEYKNDKSELQKYLSTGFRLTILFSGGSGVLLVLFCRYLSQWILFDAQYFYVFMLFGISLIFISINNFFLSVLNGFKEFRKFVIVNILTNLLSLMFTLILVWLYGLKGALVAVVTYQGIVVFMTLYFLKNKAWLSKKIFERWDKETLKKFFSYALMALVSAFTLPTAQLLIRGYIINRYSITDAGFWEAMNKISGMYLMFITSSFSVYYLPRLSEITDHKLLKVEIFQTYKIITPILLVSLILIFLLKDIVINLLFTKEFYPMKSLFFWQLLGDFFKILSWLLAFVMVAKSMTKLYIVTEVFFSTTLVVFSYFFINRYGVIGATQSYCLNYFLYLVIMILIFRKKLKISL